MFFSLPHPLVFPLSTNVERGTGGEVYKLCGIAYIAMVTMKEIITMVEYPRSETIFFWSLFPKSVPLTKINVTSQKSNIIWDLLSVTSLPKGNASQVTPKANQFMAIPKGINPKNRRMKVVRGNLITSFSGIFPLLTSMAENKVKAAKNIATKLHKTWGMIMIKGTLPSYLRRIGLKVPEFLSGRVTFTSPSAVILEASI